MFVLRDELRMTIEAYQTLYESSVAYGLRKALRAQQDKEEIQDQVTIISFKKNAELKLERRNSKGRSGYTF